MAEAMHFVNSNNVEFNHIFSALSSGYDEVARHTYRRKENVLIRHEAAQLTRLFLDLSGGGRSVLTLGDAIRKRRLDLGLLQKDVAAVIGCDEDTITNWEKGRRHPQIGQIGKVVEFLGYSPFAADGSLAERLMNYRKARGLRQKDFARKLGIDPSILASYEQGHQPTEKYHRILKEFLKASSAPCVMPTGVAVQSG